MSQSIRILADENVKFKLVKFLSSKGIDIKYASKGLKNSHLFLSALKQKRILLTNDSDFLNPILYSAINSPGVILLRIHPPELSKLESAMLKLLEKFLSKDIEGKALILREDNIEVME